MGNFMMPYIENEVFKKNPFATLDTVGVGQLMRMAVWTLLDRKIGPAIGSDHRPLLIRAALRAEPAGDGRGD